MVTRLFFVKGKSKEIFSVGFRPALVGVGIEKSVRVHASNLKSQDKVKVIINADLKEDIEEFHEFIKTNDIRISTESTSPTYDVSEMEDYEGPEINWDSYQLGMLTNQMYKGFVIANKELSSLSEKTEMGFRQANDSLVDLSQKVTTLEQKYDIIGKSATSINDKLDSIDKKLSSVDDISRKLDALPELNESLKGIVNFAVDTFADLKNDLADLKKDKGKEK